MEMQANIPEPTTVEYKMGSINHKAKLDKYYLRATHGFLVIKSYSYQEIKISDYTTRSMPENTQHNLSALETA